MSQTIQEEIADRSSPATRPAPSLPLRLARLALSEYSTLLLTLIYFLAVWPLAPELASADVLFDLAMNMLPLLAVAIGQTIVLITGGIDLSVTSIIALASVVGASIMTAAGGHLAGHPAAVPAALACMISIGALIGLFNGLAIAVLGMPAFMVTLATMMFVGGIAIWSANSQSIGHLPPTFTAIGSGALGFLPYPLLIVGALALLAHLMLGRTLRGQWIYAVGHSPRVSAISGVPVKRVIVAVYVLAGLCAAISSILYTARLKTGDPTLGRDILLDVVGAAVVGGTSLFGGKGKILWTVFGVLLFALIDKTLNLLDLQHYTIMMVKGGIILLAAALDRLRVRLSAGR